MNAPETPFRKRALELLTIRCAAHDRGRRADETLRRLRSGLGALVHGAAGRNPGPSDAVAGNDQFFGSFSFTGTIAAGQSIVRTQTITTPINLRGNRWAVVRTEVGNTIYEHANEGNNTRLDDVPINVRLSPFPNLQVTNVTAPATAFSGQQTVVQWTGL